jgi:hypothetical protein
VKIELSPVPRGGRAFRVARALFVDEGNPPQETPSWLRERLLADMDVREIESGRVEVRGGNTPAYRAELLKKRGADI